MNIGMYASTRTRCVASERQRLRTLGVRTVQFAARVMAVSCATHITFVQRDWAIQRRLAACILAVANHLAVLAVRALDCPVAAFARVGADAADDARLGIGVVALEFEALCANAALAIQKPGEQGEMSTSEHRLKQDSNKLDMNFAPSGMRWCRWVCPKFLLHLVQ